MAKTEITITTFVLSKFGKSVAVIILKEGEDLFSTLMAKVLTAIKEEECADSDGQSSITFGRIGDWGEDSRVHATYVNNGELISDDEYILTKIVSY
jgi:hypothetical protein